MLNIKVGIMNRRDMVDTTESKLQDILDEKRLTMASLARMANVSVEVVRRIRDGLSVRRDKFLAIVNSLEIRPEELVKNWK